MTIATLKVPDDFATTSGRAWFVNPFDTIPAWGALAAIVPGFILTVLFFFDHNVSSLLSQARARPRRTAHNTQPTRTRTAHNTHTSQSTQHAHAFTALPGARPLRTAHNTQHTRSHSCS
eukprot:2075628-Prymnesium_polylepis.1